MADTPQKGTAKQAAPSAKQSVVDTMTHRAGAMRMTVIGLFAFLHTFRDKYRIVLEFAGDVHVDITETLLMRVRVIARNTPKGKSE